MVATKIKKDEHFKAGIAPITKTIPFYNRPPTRRFINLK
jgi:hypothetical protein